MIKGNLLATVGLPRSGKSTWAKEQGFPIVSPDAIDTMFALQQAGHKIILWTCRSGETLQDAVDWLKEQYGFIPDAVNENIDKGLDFADKKVVADMYVDDRSFPPFTDWLELKASVLEDYFK